MTLEYLVHVSYSLKEILWRSLETDSTQHSAHKSSELLKHGLLTFEKKVRGKTCMVCLKYTDACLIQKMFHLNINGIAWVYNTACTPFCLLHACHLHWSVLKCKDIL